jgi:hypothetical protein
VKKILIVLMVLALTACAHMNEPGKDRSFEGYRAQLKAERAAGQITGVQEQEKLRDRYWEMYGKDPQSAGHFAFSMSLMRSAEDGLFPMQEAQSMIDAREAQIYAMKMASRRDDFCTYDCRPD